MVLPAEYSWLAVFLETDSLWYEDSLNWDEVFDLCVADFSLLHALFNSYFNNSFTFISSFTKLSILDVLLLTFTDKYNFAKELFDFFILDIYFLFNANFYFLNFLFFTDYQDFFSLVLYYSPELILAVSDFANIYLNNSAFLTTIAATYDMYADVLSTVWSEFTESLLLFYYFIWLIIFFFNSFNFSKWALLNENYIYKLYLYTFTLSHELRIQFEVALHVLFFFIFYWSMAIASFDDDQEEIIDVIDISFFFFFLSMIGFLFIKYSIHYFSFLEASINDTNTIKVITKQFVRDITNTFALFLRAFTLLLRLNVYDTLDDLYDSYYIYVGDFDDDEYLSELWISFSSVLFYDSDVHDDRIYSLEEEADLNYDLFYIYFMCFAKLYLFIFFIVEEIGRLLLAFYICYLILFEVHAVNCSYKEDRFFFKKK